MSSTPTFFRNTALAVLGSETNPDLANAVKQFLAELKTYTELPNKAAAYAIAETLVKPLLERPNGGIETVVKDISGHLNTMAKQHPGLALAIGQFLANLRVIRTQSAIVGDNLDELPGRRLTL